MIGTTKIEHIEQWQLADVSIVMDTSDGTSVLCGNQAIKVEREFIGEDSYVRPDYIRYDQIIYVSNYRQGFEIRYETPNKNQIVTLEFGDSDDMVECRELIIAGCKKADAKREHLLSIAPK